METTNYYYASTIITTDARLKLVTVLNGRLGINKMANKILLLLLGYWLGTNLLRAISAESKGVPVKALH